MTDRPGVPAEEWTDDEWLAVMRVVPPDAPATVGEQAVAELRGAATDDRG